MKVRVPTLNPSPLQMAEVAAPEFSSLTKLSKRLPLPANQAAF